MLVFLECADCSLQASDLLARWVDAYVSTIKRECRHEATTVSGREIDDSRIVSTESRHDRAR
jgi:hypothetical protein